MVRVRIEETLLYRQFLCYHCFDLAMAHIRERASKTHQKNVHIIENMDVTMNLAFISPKYGEAKPSGDLTIHRSVMTIDCREIQTRRRVYMQPLVNLLLKSKHPFKVHEISRDLSIHIVFENTTGNRALHQTILLDMQQLLHNEFRKSETPYRFEYTVMETYAVFYPLTVPRIAHDLGLWSFNYNRENSNLMRSYMDPTGDDGRVTALVKRPRT